MPAGPDTKYLQELVGEALSRGCAAAVEAQPNDPVEYLGQWLLRYVKNAQIVGEFAKEKEEQLKARKAELEAAEEAAAKAKAAEEERKAVLADLAKSVGEPRDLFKKAVDLIIKYTSAGAAYAAAVAEPEEPDWQYPEDPEDPAAVESEDEADPVPVVPGEGEGEEAPAEPAPAEGEGGEEAAEGEEAAPKIPKPIDYSKKYLSYMVGSQGQEFMATTELHRPPPPPEDDPEAPTEPVPFTFRILDEKRPMVYLPNVAFEPSVRFFRNFPKVGSYQACGIQAPGTGEFKAVIAADTLFPEAGGQPLSQEDQDFIWGVCRSLNLAYEEAEKSAAAAVEGKSAKEMLETLKETIKNIYFPPPEPGAEGAAAAAPAAPPVEEGGEEGAAEGGEPEGDDPVSLAKAEVKEAEGALKAAEEARTKAGEALDVARKVLGAINGAVASVADVAVAKLRGTRVVPQATFHVLKAVLHVLGKPPATFSNWKRAFAYFTPDLFTDIQDYDATKERDAEAWKAARCCYKGLPAEGADAALENEMPECALGTLLFMWLKQARKVGRRAAAYREAQAAEEGAQKALAEKQAALEAAEKQKAEEEEAARKAAEEEAALAAAEGEGGEGEGEEEEGYE